MVAQPCATEREKVPTGSSEPAALPKHGFKLFNMLGRKVISETKRIITRMLSSRELELKDVHAPLRGPATLFTGLLEQGLKIGTVIDVGVAWGTPWLMDVFETAYTVLVEPNEGFRSAIDAIMADRAGEVHYVAAGAATGDAVLHVSLNVPDNSSMTEPSATLTAMNERRGLHHELRDMKVPVRPLDSLDRRNWPKPYLLKLDCEDYEAEVLRGATEVLRDTVAIVSEIAVFNRTSGSHDFARMIGEFDRCGFELFDVVDLAQIGRKGRLVYMDAVFVQKGGHLATS